LSWDVCLLVVWLRRLWGAVHVLHLGVHVRTGLHWHASWVKSLRRIVVLLGLHVRVSAISSIWLRVLHGHRLVHVRCAWKGWSKSWAASCLMGGIGEVGHSTSLTLEWRSHCATALARIVSVWGISRRVTHLLLVLRVEISSASATLWRESTAALASTRALVVQICLRGLIRFTAEMPSLLTVWCKRSLVSRCLSHVTIAIATETAKCWAITLTSQTRRWPSTACRWLRNWGGRLCRGGHSRIRDRDWS
jgi:hypothetical protein